MNLCDLLRYYETVQEEMPPCQNSTFYYNSKMRYDDVWHAQVGVFHHDLSEHLNISHNFKTSNVCDIVSTLFSLPSNTPVLCETQTL